MDKYLIIWAITGILGMIECNFVNKKDKVVIAVEKSFFPCVFLCFISGMRAISVGNDTSPYAHYFLKMSTQKVKLFNHSAYWLYDLFVLVVRRFTNNIWVFNLFCSILIFSCLHIFVKKFSTDGQFSMLLYMSLGFFFNSMNQTRQNLALAFLLIGFYFVIKKRLIWALIFCMFATFIHNVAVVMVPVYFFVAVAREITQKTVWIVSFTSVGVAILYNSFIRIFVYIFPRYRAYLNISKFLQERKSIYRYGDVLLALLVQIALLYVIIKCNREKKHDEMACVLACMNAINLCMTYLVTNAQIFVRIKGIFGSWMIISIPFVIEKCFGNNRIVKTIVAFASLIYMFRLGVKDGDGVVPYSFFWQ